ncbi:unnamed protein product [Notodromas monacha]|uniref:Uncharacterized protein n=1 Tax=Notodromas monacha TaxID=399045 RepID=A0A7R9BPP3_9CRUS|nr:unnamed protein product [Notodromas monacha]CAG0919347.1 unnamed protein product [Notodromas monacha]
MGLNGRPGDVCVKRPPNLSVTSPGFMSEATTFLDRMRKLIFHLGIVPEGGNDCVPVNRFFFLDQTDVLLETTYTCGAPQFDPKPLNGCQAFVTESRITAEKKVRRLCRTNQARFSSVGATNWSTSPKLSSLDVSVSRIQWEINDSSSFCLVEPGHGPEPHLQRRSVVRGHHQHHRQRRRDGWQQQKDAGDCCRHCVKAAVGRTRRNSLASSTAAASDQQQQQPTKEISSSSDRNCRHVPGDDEMNDCGACRRHKSRKSCPASDDQLHTRKSMSSKLRMLHPSDAHAWTPKLVRVFDNGRHKMVVVILPSSSNKDVQEDDKSAANSGSSLHVTFKAHKVKATFENADQQQKLQPEPPPDDARIKFQSRGCSPHGPHDGDTAAGGDVENNAFHSVPRASVVGGELTIKRSDCDPFFTASESEDDDGFAKKADELVPVISPLARMRRIKCCSTGNLRRKLVRDDAAQTALELHAVETMTDNELGMERSAQTSANRFAISSTGTPDENPFPCPPETSSTLDASPATPCHQRFDTATTGASSQLLPHCYATADELESESCSGSVESMPRSDVDETPGMSGDDDFADVEKAELGSTLVSTRKEDYLTCCSGVTTDTGQMSGLERFHSVGDNATRESSDDDVSVNREQHESASLGQHLNAPRENASKSAENLSREDEIATRESRVSQYGSSECLPPSPTPAVEDITHAGQTLRQSSSGSLFRHRSSHLTKFFPDSSPHDVHLLTDSTPNSSRTGIRFRVGQVQVGIKEALGTHKRRQRVSETVDEAASAMCSSDSLLIKVIEQLNELNALQRHQIELTKAGMSFVSNPRDGVNADSSALLKPSNEDVAPLLAMKCEQKDNNDAVTVQQQEEKVISAEDTKLSDCSDDDDEKSELLKSEDVTLPFSSSAVEKNWIPQRFREASAESRKGSVHDSFAPAVLQRSYTENMSNAELHPRILNSVSERLLIAPVCVQSEQRTPNNSAEEMSRSPELTSTFSFSPFSVTAKMITDGEKDSGSVANLAERSEKISGTNSISETFADDAFDVDSSYLEPASTVSKARILGSSQSQTRARMPGIHASVIPSDASSSSDGPINSHASVTHLSDACGNAIENPEEPTQQGAGVCEEEGDSPRICEQYTALPNAEVIFPVEGQPEKTHLVTEIIERRLEIQQQTLELAAVESEKGLDFSDSCRSMSSFCFGSGIELGETSSSSYEEFDLGPGTIRRSDSTGEVHKNHTFLDLTTGDARIEPIVNDDLDRWNSDAHQSAGDPRLEPDAAPNPTSPPSPQYINCVVSFSESTECTSTITPEASYSGSKSNRGSLLNIQQTVSGEFLPEKTRGLRGSSPAQVFHRPHENIHRQGTYEVVVGSQRNPSGSVIKQNVVLDPTKTTESGSSRIPCHVRAVYLASSSSLFDGRAFDVFLNVLYSRMTFGAVADRRNSPTTLTNHSSGQIVASDHAEEAVVESEQPQPVPLATFYDFHVRDAAEEIHFTDSNDSVPAPDRDPVFIEKSAHGPDHFSLADEEMSSSGLSNEPQWSKGSRVFSHRRPNDTEVLMYLDDTIADLLCLRAIRMRVMWLEDFTQKEQELTHYFYYMCMREVLRRAKPVVDNHRLLDFRPLFTRGEELEMVLLRTVQRRQEIIESMPSRHSSTASVSVDVVGLSTPPPPSSSSSSSFDQRHGSAASRIAERLLVCCDERIYALFVLCYRRWEERDKQPRDRRNPITGQTASTLDTFSCLLCKYVRGNSDPDVVLRLEHSGYLPYLRQKILALATNFKSVEA